MFSKYVIMLVEMIALKKVGILLWEGTLYIMSLKESLYL